MLETKVIRNTKKSDINQIQNLYKASAAVSVGLARNADEITRPYIADSIAKSLERGISLVAITHLKIVGEIHAYRSELSVFQHVLSELTICVAPEYQGQQIGKLLFSEFMKIVESDMLEITRIELFARESNQKAIQFYKKMGFEIEGCFRNRINGISNTLENDIPMAWLRQKIPD